MKTGCKRFLKADSGSSAVEFALCLFPFVVLMFALMGFGYVGYLKNDIDQAINEAQRLVFLDPEVSEAEVVKKLRGEFAGPPSFFETAVQRTEDGDFVVYAIRTRLELSMPVISNLMGRPFELTAERVIRL